MSKTKYAVFTMDVEAFSDIECVNFSDPETDMAMMDGLDEYLRILDRFGIKSTLFTVGNLAPKITDRLKTYIANGHRIALHSLDHTLSTKLSPDQFRQSTEAAKQSLSNLLGTDVIGFRAPCFTLDNERLNIIKELGFTYDSSYLGFPLADHHSNLDFSGFSQLRSSLFYDKGFFEFGLPKQKLLGVPFPVSGGAYLRLPSWPLIRGTVHRYINQNDYYVFYLHPFELTEQPIPVPRQLKSHQKYYLRAGIHSFSKIIEQIIEMLKKDNYEFVTFEELTDILQKEAQQNT